MVGAGNVPFEVVVIDDDHASIEGSLEEQRRVHNSEIHPSLRRPRRGDSSTPDSAIVGSRNPSVLQTMREEQLQTTTPGGLAQSAWQFPLQASFRSVDGSGPEPISARPDRSSDDTPASDLQEGRLEPDLPPGESVLSFHSPSSTPRGLANPSNPKQPGPGYVDLENWTPGLDTSVSAGHVSPGADPIIIESDDSDESSDESGTGFHHEDFMSETEFQEAFGATDPRQRPPMGRLSKRKSSATPVRNGPLKAYMRELDSYQLPNVGKLCPKKAVQLRDGDFLKITLVVLDNLRNEVSLRGWRLRRTKELDGLLPKKRNEVCLVIEVDEDDAREPKVQGAEEVPLSEVTSLRRIVMTNRPYPECSFSEKEARPVPDHIVYTEYPLVCRWKLVTRFATAKKRVAKSSSEKALLVLREDECEHAYGVDDESLRFAFRGRTVKGGAYVVPPRDETNLVEIDADLEPETEAVPEEGLGMPVAEPYKSLSPNLFRRDIGYAGRRQEVIALDERPPPRRPSTTLPLRPSAAPPARYTASDLRPSSRGLHATSPIRLEPMSPSSEALHRRDNRRDEERHLHVREDGQFELPQRCQPRKSSHQLSSGGREPESSMPNPTFGQALQANSSVPETPVHTLREPDSLHANFATNSSDGPRLKRQRTSTATYPSPPQSRSSILSCLSAASYPSGHTPLHGTTLASEAPSTHGATEAVDTRKHRYTFGDGFCGAGGMSRGALMAGLRVKWGFDKDTAAIETFQKNFSTADPYQCLVSQFVALSEGDEHLEVDILHLSPPCQTFSSAHTIDGKDDDDNSASFFGVMPVVKKVRPRVVTLENTSGLAERHVEWANSVVHMFTALGFSVRWRLLNCAEFGSYQARRRLFLLASCPGEVLPEFPKPTHSSDVRQQILKGRKPLRTVADAISDIPESCSNHDVEGAAKKSLAAYDASVPLPRCITTGGGGNYHPSGRRALTLREHACLQAFPLEHQFSKTGVMRQIGNAVPPVVGKTVLEAVKDALMKADGLI